VLGVLVLGATVLAQPPAFRARTELVAMNVTVVDAKGTPVRGLAREAFTVSEDGQPRAIEQFANGHVPLSLVVALDASGSMVDRRLVFAKEAVMRLVDRLGPEDELRVLGFNDAPFIVTFWTRDRTAIRDALNPVKAGGSTAMYGAVSQAIDELSAARHRKNLWSSSPTASIASEDESRRSIESNAARHWCTRSASTCRTLRSCGDSIVIRFTR
jgi:VWFA-related protein